MKKLERKLLKGFDGGDVSVFSGDVSVYTNGSNFLAKRCCADHVRMPSDDPDKSVDVTVLHAVT